MLEPQKPTKPKCDNTSCSNIADRKFTFTPRGCSDVFACSEACQQVLLHEHNCTPMLTTATVLDIMPALSLDDTALGAALAGMAEVASTDGGATTNGSKNNP